VKFDGWRVQLNKDGGVERLLTRGGFDATQRFRQLAARSCIIDGEVVACNGYGVRDFLALHFRNARSAVVVAWAKVVGATTLG
jgi:ATP-dependent DNA ligase